MVLSDQFLQVFFFPNWNTVRIERPGQLTRVTAVGNIGDLGGGESNDVKFSIVAKNNVEIVEVAPGGTQDDGSLHRYAPMRNVET